MKKIILFSCLILSNITHAHKVGNGGDYIRGTFISIGKSILNYLNDSKEGQELISKYSLSTDELDKTLDIYKISVTDALLTDNTQSLVDAIGIPGFITLQNNSWADHFQNNRDIYYLVFHEMLRSASINDDNYLISEKIKNFPISKRIDTKITSKTPLIDEDQTINLFKNESITVAGTGCKKSFESVITELNEEKNIFQVIFKNYQTSLVQGNIKSCSLAIPMTIPKNKRLIISLIDLNGNFYHNKNSSSKITLEAFTSGISQKSTVKNLKMPELLNRSFLLRKTDLLKTKCGGSEILRLNTYLSSTGFTNLEKGFEFTTIKSLALYFTLEECQ